MTATPQQIIETFDEVLDAIYGRENGRDYPAKDDFALATKWIGRGATVEICRAVFIDQMERLHAKWVDRASATDRSMIPHGLKIVDEYVELALLAPTRLIDGQAMRFSQWRARVIGWARTGIWFDSLYESKPPNAVGTRVPQTVLNDLAETIKTAKQKK